MITDDKLQELIEYWKLWLDGMREDGDEPEDDQLDVFASLQELQTLRESAERYENRLHNQKGIVELGIERERELCRQNQALIEDAERLAKEYLYAIQDIEGFAHDSGVDVKVLNSRETLYQHKALMKEING